MAVMRIRTRQTTCPTSCLSQPPFLLATMKIMSCTELEHSPPTVREANRVSLLKGQPWMLSYVYDTEMVRQSFGTPVVPRDDSRRGHQD